MRHDVTYSLLYQIQRLIWQNLTQDKIEEIFRQFSFLWHCYIALAQGCTKLFITEKRAYSQWKMYIINHSKTCAA